MMPATARDSGARGPAKTSVNKGRPGLQPPCSTMAGASTAHRPAEYSASASVGKAVMSPSRTTGFQDAWGAPVLEQVCPPVQSLPCNAATSEGAFVRMAVFLSRRPPVNMQEE